VRLLFIVNPKSGRGRGLALAAEFTSALRAHATSIEQVVIGTPETVPGHPAWAQHLAKADAGVVFGGDGTVHSLLPSLVEARVPIYHVPMGTENLFARQFGMSSDPSALRDAVEKGRVETIDVGEANGRLFAIMCSAGPDASVVHRLAARRTGAIRHSSYIRPMVAETFRPALGPYRVEVDGRVLVEGGRGLVVVANSAMYALGMNPARGASMHDGMLDVLYMPASSTLGVVRWFARARLKDAASCAGARFCRGRSVILAADGPAPYQLDGDRGGVISPRRPTGAGESETAGGGSGGELRIGVHPGAGRVLVRA
jgi:diacylglycerol kinase family enzyme